MIKTKSPASYGTRNFLCTNLKIEKKCKMAYSCRSENGLILLPGQFCGCKSQECKNHQVTQHFEANYQRATATNR